MTPSDMMERRTRRGTMGSNKKEKNTIGENFTGTCFQSLADLGAGIMEEGSNKETVIGTKKH